MRTDNNSNTWIYFMLNFCYRQTTFSAITGQHKQIPIRNLTELKTEYEQPK